MRNLDDRTAVVAGAASGICRALAALLAQRPCHRALVDGAKERLEELVKHGAIGPEKVAAATVKGIERGKLRVRVGPDAFVGGEARRWFPTDGQRILARFMANQLP